MTNRSIESSKEIVIAIPSATSKEIRAIMAYVRETNIRDVKVLPGISDLMNGKVTLKDVRDISIKDLLGREQVEIDMRQVSSYIRHKTILVTGAGGSIGSELCRQIAKFNPAKLIMLDMGEPVSIYKIAEELIRLSGLEPDKDIPIMISGKRPGEKLFEELLAAEEGTSATHHEKIFSAKKGQKIDKKYLKKVDRLISVARENKDDGRIFSILKDLVPTYERLKPERGSKP